MSFRWKCGGRDGTLSTRKTFTFTKHLVGELIFRNLTSLKTPTSLNKEVRPFFSYATIAFGVSPLFLFLAITAFGGFEGNVILESIACGACEFIVPKDLALRGMNFRKNVQ